MLTSRPDVTSSARCSRPEKAQGTQPVDIWTLLPVASLVAAVFLVRPWLESPLNDDWMYAKDALLTAQNHKLTLTGWESAWGLPQIWLGAALIRLFGFSHAMLRLVGILGAVLATIALDALLRRRGLVGPYRAVAGWTLAFCPPMFIVSQSFMTDAPFLALWMWSCYLLDVGWEERSKVHTVLGALLACLCIGQRQFGILIPAAACCSVLLTRRLSPPERRFRIGYLVACALAAGSFFVFGSAWRSIAGSWTPSLAPLSSIHDIRRAITSLFTDAGLTLATTMVPLLVLVSPVRWRRYLRSPVGLVAGAVVAAGVLFSSHSLWAETGNLISPFGVFKQSEVLPGARQEVLSTDLRRLVSLGGFVCLWGLVAIALHELRPSARPLQSSPRPLALTSKLSGFGLLFVTVAVRGYVFDRYFLPVLPAVILVVSGHLDATRRRMATAGGLLACLAAFSLSTQSDYLRWNEARLEAAEWVVAQGVAPANLLGGYEWDGWHRAVVRPWDPSRSRFGAWWLGMLAPADTRAVLSFSPLPGTVTWHEVPYPSIWGPSERKIYVLRADDDVVVDPDG